MGEIQKQKHRLDLTAMAILVVLCASWGFQQVTIKIANHGISPILQSGIRSFGATVLVWGWMALRKQPMLQRDGTLWWGILVGVLFALEFLLIYWGLEFTNASRAIVFLYLSPFVVAIGAQLFLPAERLGMIQVAGLSCAFAGLLVAFGESLRLPDANMLIGDGMLIAAAVLWGATTVMIKAGPLAGIAPGKTLLYQLAVSAVILPVGSLAMGEAGIVAITPEVVLCLAYQTVWVASVTYLAWFWLIFHYPASRLASFSFLTPIFGVLAGGIFLDEPITGALLLSLVLVGGGIYLVNRPEGRRTKVVAAPLKESMK